MPYDLIGDIHGHASSLRALLEKLGYQSAAGSWRHPRGRRVIFLGDFIDRGPQQREVLEMVWSMLDAGTALAVMGNHEFNAIGWATPHPQRAGEWLRPHSEKNRRQHQAFLQAYPDERERQAVIERMLDLPLWLELDGLRVVHAFWDEPAMRALQPLLRPGNLLDPERLEPLYHRGSAAHEACERLLKGCELPLPDGCPPFVDKDGHPRGEIRVRWWLQERQPTLKTLFQGRERDRQQLPDLPVRHLPFEPYPPDAPPVFVGHYWMAGRPEPMADNVACLDWSVAADGLPEAALVAYRWDGERRLRPERFVSVARQEPLTT